MMNKKNEKKYEVIGVPMKLIKKWEKYDLLKDIKVYVNRNNKQEFKIELYLTTLEALKVKMDIKKYNQKNKCSMTINKCKGKRFRV